MEELSWILRAKWKSRLVKCLWNSGWVHEMTLRAMFHTELNFKPSSFNYHNEYTIIFSSQSVFLFWILFLKCFLLSCQILVMFALIKFLTQILTLAEVAENVFYCHHSLKKKKKNSNPICRVTGLGSH